MSTVDTMPAAALVLGDCVERMAALAGASVDAVVTDPPYGLEFLQTGWDRLWETGAGFTAVGIGRRDTDWPSHGTGSAFGGANPTCATCGGRLRGRRRCSCAEPAWRVAGRRVTACNGDGQQIMAGHAKQMQEWHTRWALEALRVIKPGGHLVAFGGTRTFHRLACALEDAGFEVRNVVGWIFLSGFPKAKGQLKPAWEPILLCRKPMDGTIAANVARHGVGDLDTDACRLDRAAADTSGWAATGTAGTEAVKGFAGTAGFAIRERAPEDVAEAQSKGRWPPNVAISHAPGCIRAGVAPAGGDGHWPRARPANDGGSGLGGHGGQDGLAERSAAADLAEVWACADGCPAATLDAQAGPRRSGAMAAGGRRRASRGSGGYGGGFPDVYEVGGRPARVAAASRWLLALEDEPPFQYVPKAPGRERWGACSVCGDILAKPLWRAHAAGHPAEPRPRLRSHPTVKPLALMRWLVRLVAPAGSLVLDPFAGSATTLIAARMEGRRALGFERDPGYFALGQARLREGP